MILAEHEKFAYMVCSTKDAGHREDHTRVETKKKQSKHEQGERREMLSNHQTMFHKQRGNKLILRMGGKGLQILS